MARALRPPPPMTVDEFLVWDDGTWTKYELEDGMPVAMSPPVVPHARIAQNVGAEIDRLVEDRPPCRALQGAGIVISREKRRVYIPDVLMTCEPLRRDNTAQTPALIVEVLSPSTKGVDQRRKIPAYQRLPSVEEIWLVDSRVREVRVWRRGQDGWPEEPTTTKGSGTFESPALGGEIGLDRLYRLSAIDD